MKNNVIPDKFIDSKREHLINVVSAVVTGGITDTITNPFWVHKLIIENKVIKVLKTRIQSEYLHTNTNNYSGIIKGINKIYKQVPSQLRIYGII